MKNSMPDITLTYKRCKTDSVQIGNVAIGGNHPICVQTMANVSTNDINGSLEQLQRVCEAGAQMVRFTTQGTKEVESLKIIHNQWQQRNPKAVPLVADVHFQADVADKAAQVVEKVRINPGNYIDPARKFKQINYTQAEYEQELQQLADRFNRLLDICEQHQTALRIGVNHGSLSDRIMSRYGNSVEGMVESCMEFLRVAKKRHFANIVVSLKASNTRLMVDSVRKMVQQMEQENMFYPIHLGVTEAGEGEDGRIKSAVGIGALLAEGIGDTVRMSLSEPPENEIESAQCLIDYFVKADSVRYTLVQCSQENGIVKYKSQEKCDWQTFQIHAAADCGWLLWKYEANDLQIINDHFEPTKLEQLSKDILQASRIRMYKTEYISCPGCGRTLFDLPTVIAQVKVATAQYTGLKIAIMG
ncbi:MAG: (E)-4-hydroxy-3-methylbut-2-enyl-diphosphate synthase, partial [Paludibacteraceae bacterium]|nr:(E)-4-hydroxy-3-methylbut-2-enyl-diphosphate synthase [Paludibacteraceae bacterium]